VCAVSKGVVIVGVTYLVVTTILYLVFLQATWPEAMVTVGTTAVSVLSIVNVWWTSSEPTPAGDAGGAGAGAAPAVAVVPVGGGGGGV
jgi:hypothetical protein